MAPKIPNFRCCLVCGKELVTCKTYVSLKGRQDVLGILMDCVGENFQLTSQTVCRVCHSKLVKLKSSRELKDDVARSYRQTKAGRKENIAPEDKLETPKKVQEQGRVKRMAISSLGSPSVSQHQRKYNKSVSDKGKANAEEFLHKCTEVLTLQKGKLRKRVPIKWIPIVNAIMEDDEHEVISKVHELGGLNDYSVKVVKQLIASECYSLCSPQADSLFRKCGKHDMLSFSYDTQRSEMQTHAPVLQSLLQTAATNPRIERNKVKTTEVLVPGIVTAAAILFNCRSSHMNSHQLLTGLTLWEGGCHKRTFARLGARNLCSSYYYVIKKQEEFGEGFDSEVKDWGKQLLDAKEMGQSDEKEVLHCPSFQLVMDNVDMRVKARHTTRENYGSDYHMVNILAVKDRVNAQHLSNDFPDVNTDKIDLAKFLPTSEEEKALKNDWCILMGHIISEHLPHLKWMSRELPQQIPHDHMEEAKQKTKVANLGVLMENENTSEGIYRIMHHMHKYVPGHDNEQPMEIICAGDLLTCERESNCIEEQQNSKSSNQRLDGFIPVIADFHAYANFLQVIWQHLYDTSSSADKITLYAARNFLEARNVTANPMKDINAASDLIETYTKSLVTAAAMEYFGMKMSTDKPTRNDFNLQVHHDRSYYVKTALTDIIGTFFIPRNDEVSQVSQFKCTQCIKEYKTRNGLRKHIRANHAFKLHAPAQDIAARADENDSLFNYARCATSMCLLALNFNDARKMGDGARLIRMYKYMLLHFKASGKHKYSFQVLRLLAQVHCFLSPRLSYRLVWNRFVNTKGKPKGNIEVDRENEHQNGVFKSQCKALGGKITKKSVDRVSQCAQVSMRC